MAEIPPIVWLVIGVVVAVVSWIAKMDVFFWVGLIFIAFGAFKIVTSGLWSKKEGALAKKVDSSLKQEFNKCPDCNSPAWESQNFCHVCGTRLS